MAKGKSTAYEYNVDIRAQFEKLSGDIAGVAKQFKGMERNVTGVFKNINTIINATFVTFGIASINKFRKSLEGMAAKGEAVSGISDAFEKLGGSSGAIAAASQATKGLVSQFDLMQVANSALLKGVPDVNKNLALMADYAARLSSTLKIDTVQALQQVSDAIASGKEKMLQQVGITVDAETAYKNYALQLGITTTASGKWKDALSDSQQKIAMQIESTKVMAGTLEKLVPTGDSVANSIAKFNIALQDGYKIAAVAMNKNEDMAKAYDQLAKVVNKLDWEEIGKSIGRLGGVFAQLASIALPQLTGALQQFIDGLDYIAQASDNAKLDKMGVQVLALGNEFYAAQEKLQRLKDAGMKSGDKYYEDLIADAIVLKKQYDEAFAAFNNLRDKVGAGKLGPMYGPENKPIGYGTGSGGKGGGVSDNVANAAKKAAEEIKKADEALQKLIETNQKAGVTEGLQTAFERLDPQMFKKYNDMLYLETFSAAIRGLGDGFEKQSKENQQKGIEAAKKAADIASQDQQDKFAKAQADAAKEGSEKASQYYQDTADSIRSSFESAFDAAVSGDWKSALKDLALDFASNLAAAFETGITGNPSVQNGMMSLGAMLAKGVASLFGSMSGGGAGGGGALSGLGDFASSIGGLFSGGGRPPGVEGPLLADGSFATPGTFGAAGTVAGVAGTAATLIGAFSAKKTPNNNATEGGQVGAVAGAGIGAAIGGPAGMAIGASIGQMLGGIIGSLFKTGLNHPESKARVAFEQWLEGQFKEMGKLRFFDKGGKLGKYFDGNFIGKAKTPDFSPGPNGEPPAFMTNLDKLGEKTKATFLGVGEAMKELRGITEDVGSHIGYLLSENLAGNVDNLRLLFQDLGISFEQMSEALLKSALKGSITWLQFNSYIRDTAEAFKPGLVAVGAIGDAMQNLIDSAGQGREAVKGFKDIAVEALEAGATSMEQAKQMLLDKGFDPEYVNNLFAAAAARGIKTLEEWANASDLTAGSVVGDLEASSKKLQDTWAELRNSLKEMKKDLEEMPAEVKSNVKLTFHSEFDDNTKEAMAKIPEATPTVVPSSETSAPRVARSYTFSGTATARSLRATMGGGSSGTVINVDARGATPGVEAQITQAARFMEAKISAGVMSQLQSRRTRGGRAGDSY